jgi:TPR repeat protein
MKWTRLITLSLTALVTFSSMADNKLDNAIKLAEQGHLNAQYFLGIMYREGVGVPQDYKQVFKWYTKAAEQGHTKAQFSIGLMYQQGLGVIQNNKAAYIWWAISASYGDESSINNRDIIAKKLSIKTLKEAKEEAGKLYEKINSAKH